MQKLSGQCGDSVSNCTPVRTTVSKSPDRWKTHNTGSVVPYLGPSSRLATPSACKSSMQKGSTPNGGEGMRP